MYMYMYMCTQLSQKYSCAYNYTLLFYMVDVRLLEKLDRRLDAKPSKHNEGQDLHIGSQFLQDVKIVD